MQNVNLTNMIEGYANLIRRDKYIKMIAPYIGREIIKVISGQRRVGKSYVLKIYQIT